MNIDEEMDDLVQQISRFGYHVDNITEHLIIAEAIVFFYAEKQNSKHLDNFGEFLKKKVEAYTETE